MVSFRLRIRMALFKIKIAVRNTWRRFREKYVDPISAPSSAKMKSTAVVSVASAAIGFSNSVTMAVKFGIKIGLGAKFFCAAAVAAIAATVWYNLPASEEDITEEDYEVALDIVKSSGVGAEVSGDFLEPIELAHFMVVGKPIKEFHDDEIEVPHDSIYARMAEDARLREESSEESRKDRVAEAKEAGYDDTEETNDYVFEDEEDDEEDGRSLYGNLNFKIKDPAEYAERRTSRLDRMEREDRKEPPTWLEV